MVLGCWQKPEPWLAAPGNHSHQLGTVLKREEKKLETSIQISKTKQKNSSQDSLVVWFLAGGTTRNSEESHDIFLTHR